MYQLPEGTHWQLVNSKRGHTSIHVFDISYKYLYIIGMILQHSIKGYSGDIIVKTIIVVLSMKLNSNNN